MSLSSVIISLPVADRQTSYAFYRAALGLEAFGEPADDGVPEPLQFAVNDGLTLMTWGPTPQAVWTSWSSGRSGPVRRGDPATRTACTPGQGSSPPSRRSRNTHRLPASRTASITALPTAIWSGWFSAPGPKLSW